MKDRRCIAPISVRVTEKERALLAQFAEAAGCVGGNGTATNDAKSAGLDGFSG